MANTQSTITSYSPEMGLVARKPQFNGLPASLHQGGTLPAGTSFMDKGALVTTPAVVDKVEGTPKDAETVQAS